MLDGVANAAFSPLDGASTAASSPRNDFVKNYRVHPTHWLICTQVGYSDWDEVASYQSWSPLKSKGTLGGAYSYIDATVSEGEWLYPVRKSKSRDASPPLLNRGRHARRRRDTLLDCVEMPVPHRSTEP